MGLQADIEAAAAEILAARTEIIADKATLDGIVNGPASGPSSTVTTTGGPVKTAARVIAELEALGGALAPLESPTFTGTPSAPTAALGSNTTQIANMSALLAAINALRSELVNGAPGALDALNELAAALGNDANFATTVTNALALKAPLNSPVFTGAPTAPTVASGDNSDRVATTAFVADAIAEVGGLAVASQSEARAGTDNEKMMTPLRVKEATGRWLLLDVTASNVATVDLTGVFTADYDHYEIVLDKVKVATDDVWFNLRVGTGAGPTWQASGYGWAHCFPGISSTVMALDNQTNFGVTSSMVISGTATGNRLGNAAGEVFSGVIHVSNPTGTDYPNISWNVVHNRSSDSAAINIVGGGLYGAGIAITGLRFLASTGNIASGRFRVYGLRAVA